MRQLKAELEELKRQNASGNVVSSSPAVADGSTLDGDTPATAVTAASAGSDAQDVVKSMGLVLLESSDHPRFMGTSSGVTFAKMVLAAVNQDVSVVSASAPPQDQNASAAPHAIMGSSLPPHHAAQRIVDVYFSYRTPHVPVLTRAKVEKCVKHTYSALETSHDFSRALERDMFITYMVFAVGLWGSPGAGGTRSHQSEGCFLSALQLVEKLLSYSPSNLESLTLVLLLAQYTMLNPSVGSLWHLTGVALRLCIDLGLHWETAAVLNLPPTLLDERRRLFWAAYRFDRLLSIGLGRPFGIVDQSLNTPFPDPYIARGRESHLNGPDLDAQNQHAANHFVKLYRLRSEIKHVLYHQLEGGTLAYPRPNYALWFPDIQSRLRIWEEEIPDPSRAATESIYANHSWWTAHSCNAVLFLHRPNPLVPHPTPESLHISFEVSGRCIQAIKTLQREGKISVAWTWVHHLFLAGLMMIYCIWQSPEIRNTASIVEVMTAAQDCASTLSALTERFSAAGGCRDAFEVLSAATLKWLVARDKSDPSESQPPMLDNEIHQALREHIPYSNGSWRADELANIFPHEPFEFAEYLNAAAQWPGPNLDGSSVFGMQDMFDASHINLG